MTRNNGTVLHGHQGFRLWGRSGSASRAMGVTRIRKKGGGEFKPTILFQFHKDYDRVGIVDIGRLFEGSEDRLLICVQY